MTILSEEQIEEARRLYEDELMAIQPAAAAIGTAAGVLLRYFEQYGIHIRTKEENIKIRVQKAEQTNLKKYGCKNVSGNAQIKEKKKQTCLKNYGVLSGFSLNKAHKNIWITDGINDKYIKPTDNIPDGWYKGRTNLNNPYKRPEVKEKIKQTLLERYGVENPQQNTEIKAKGRQTCLEKYGAEYYTQTLEYHKKAKKHFVYEDEAFDSFPELCFYLYHIINNHDIIRNPLVIEFIVDGITHRYIPDFAVNGQLFEIKGDHFKDQDNGWCNPFSKSESAQLIAKAKYECAIANNVNILYQEDYKQYTSWFNANNYNKDDFIV